MRYLIAEADVKFPEQGALRSNITHDFISYMWRVFDRENLKHWGPFSDESEGIIRAVSDTYGMKRFITPEDYRSEHRIHLTLEIRSPVGRQLSDRVKLSFDIKESIETRVLASLEP